MVDEPLSAVEILTAATLGLGLAAAVGFRIFVPLLLVSLAAHFGKIALAADFQWLASTPALVMFGVAALLEAGAYLVPWVDHALDAVAGPAAVVAGTLLMASTLIEMESWLRWTIALVAGGGTAGLLHGTLAGLRLGSSATTGGLANPAFATFETTAATALTLLAIAIPMAACCIAVFLLARAIRGSRRFWRRVRRTEGESN